MNGVRDDREVSRVASDGAMGPYWGMEVAGVERTDCGSRAWMSRNIGSTEVVKRASGAAIVAYVLGEEGA